MKSARRDCGALFTCTVGKSHVDPIFVRFRTAIEGTR
jgi:hypothetical protein